MSSHRYAHGGYKMSYGDMISHGFKVGQPWGEQRRHYERAYDESDRYYSGQSHHYRLSDAMTPSSSQQYHNLTGPYDTLHSSRDPDYHHQSLLPYGASAHPTSRSNHAWSVGRGERVISPVSAAHSLPGYRNSYHDDLLRASSISPPPMVIRAGSASPVDSFPTDDVGYRSSSFEPSLRDSLQYSPRHEFIPLSDGSSGATMYEDDHCGNIRQSQPSPYNHRVGYSDNGYGQSSYPTAYNTYSLGAADFYADDGGRFYADPDEYRLGLGVYNGDENYDDDGVIDSDEEYPQRSEDEYDDESSTADTDDHSDDGSSEDGYSDEGSDYSDDSH